MRRLTAGLFILGIIALIYGYVCRMAHLYFFWDSKMIGWIVIFIACFSYLIDIRVARIRKGKNKFWVTLGVCFLLFGLILLPVVVFILKSSEAYTTATEYLKNDPELRKEIGDVQGFGLIPSGSVNETMTTKSNHISEEGVATFLLIVKGSRKYKDVQISLQKLPTTLWQVTSVEKP